MGMPLGHIGINVSDMSAARAYYDALMPLVGYEPFIAGEDEFSYRPAGEKPGTYIFFNRALESAGYSRHRPGLQHLAFIVPTRAAVHAVHTWVRDAGNEVVYEPQEFPQYHPGYYATFWLGHEGAYPEAVCHRDEAG